MNISVAEQPNSLNTFRYDVRMRGRSTHGFRRTPSEARSAAQEDANMLALCANVERQQEEREERDDRPTRRAVRGVRERGKRREHGE